MSIFFQFFEIETFNVDTNFYLNTLIYEYILVFVYVVYMDFMIRECLCLKLCFTFVFLHFCFEDNVNLLLIAFEDLTF